MGKSLNIRQRINRSRLSSDERMLRENKVVSDKGNLTDLGRRVVLDALWEDDGVRDKVVSMVKAVVDEENKKEK